MTTSSEVFPQEEITCPRRIPRWVRWMLVGAINTTWGLGIIVLLHVQLGADIVASNLAAYASGAVLSYILNRRYTFNAPYASAWQFVQFMLCQGVSLGVMTIVVIVMVSYGVPFLPTQVVTLILYSLTFYMLSEFVVFRHSRSGRMPCE